MSAVIERHVDIPTTAGSMDTFVSRLAGSAAVPLVIVFMDVWGVRSQLFEIAARIASQGYCAVVPNFYYRDGVKGFDFRNAQGRTISFNAVSKEQRETVMKHGAALRNEMVDADVGAVLQFFANEPVSQGLAGAVGFCMGGRHAMYVAGTRPERMAATASLHGTRLINDNPDSPHRMADRFRGEIYCGFGELDSFTPPELIAALDALLANRPGLQYRWTVHPAAQHGYSIPDRDVYDHAAAEQDWAAIFAMYSRMLV